MHLFWTNYFTGTTIYLTKLPDKLTSLVCILHQCQLNLYDILKIVHGKTQNFVFNVSATSATTYDIGNPGPGLGQAQKCLMWQD
jgi:hypothetical protein